jgi:hypothetical protein
MQKEVVEAKAAIGVVNYDKGTDDATAPISVPVEHKQISEEVEPPFVIVEQMPQFPGGEKELLNFIKNNLHYPVLAQEMGISGVVIINFVIIKRVAFRTLKFPVESEADVMKKLSGSSNSCLNGLPVDKEGKAPLCPPCPPWFMLFEPARCALIPIAFDPCASLFLPITLFVVPRSSKA